MTRFFAAEVAICPRCAQPLRRATGAQGSFYLTCDNTVPPPPGSGAHAKRCGQTVHCLAAEGVVAVTPVSKEQFARFRATYTRAREIYTELGIIVLTRDDAAGAGVPEHACSGCGQRFKLFDLYGGECRECHGNGQTKAG